MNSSTFLSLALHGAALAGLLAITTITPVTAADFPGSLKGVTITDAKAVNKPPVAAFTYTTNGNTVMLDASGSYDPDGSIASYKWDFGDGTTGEGASVTHQYQAFAAYPVSLTVVDNANGASISQKEVSTVPAIWLEDDFVETATVALTAHTPDVGGSWAMANIAAQTFTVTGGKGYVVNAGIDGEIAINNAEPPRSDYTISVTGVLNSTSYDRLFGACGRFDATGKTGYCAYLKGDGKVTLAKYTGASTVYGTVLNSKTVPIGATETYTLSLSFSGPTITATLTGVDSITMEDATYPSGKAGIILRRNNSFINKIVSN